MAIDSSVSANIMEEGRLQKIQERSKERLRLEKSKVKLYGHASEAPIPVAEKFNAMVETDKIAVPATSAVVKGKTKGKMLLGCDKAMELGVVKIVNTIDKENKKLDLLLLTLFQNMTVYSTASVNISTLKSRFGLMSLSLHLHK